MKILAVDPGTEMSGFVVFNSETRQVEESGIVENEELLHRSSWVNADILKEDDMYQGITHCSDFDQFDINAFLGVDCKIAPERSHKSNMDKYVNKKYKIYMLTCPDNKSYIGMTSLSFKDRFRDGYGYRHSKLFYARINEVGWNNISLKVLYSDLSLDVALYLETYSIEFFNTTDGEYGYNKERCGLFSSRGIKRDRESVLKRAAKARGRKITEEHRAIISKINKGKKFTEDHKRKIGLAQTGELNHMYGKRAPEDVRRKMSASQKKGKDNPFSRKVNQYDLDGSFIKMWYAMSDIKKELGALHCCISDCCRGKQKTAYGYIWKYTEDDGQHV